MPSSVRQPEEPKRDIPTFLVERVLRIYSKFILGALSVAHDMTDNPGNNPGD
jgi:hypothetical protein